MSPAGVELRRLVGAAARRVRRDVVLAVAAGMTAILPAVLLIAWAAGSGQAWAAPSIWPLLLDVWGVLLAAALGLVGWRRWRRDADPAGVAAAAEVARSLAEGSVRGVLELGDDVPAGTSPALARRAQERVAQLLRGADAGELSGEVGRRARRRSLRVVGMLLVLMAGVAVAAAVAPQRARTGWAPLARPVAQLSRPHLPPILLTPGDTTVARGARVAVRIRAPGRLRVSLSWQAAGDVRHVAVVSLRTGQGSGTLSAVDAPTRYWVEAPDGAVSDTFSATPREPLLMAHLSLDIEYPAYLGRPADRIEGEVPPLDVPEGTTIRVDGRTTRDLGGAALIGPDSQRAVTFHASGTDFQGLWTPAASGLYQWSLEGADGAPTDYQPAPIDLTVVRDQPPAVVMTFPGSDTVLTPEMRQPLAAAAADDHGILRAALVSWRVGATGEREAPVEQSVGIDGEPQRVLLQAVLDASQRHMLPGDTLLYFMRVTDNSPRRQTAVTATYRLRLPSMDELRRQVVAAASEAITQASRDADAAKQLEKTTRDLERRGVAGSNAARGSNGAAGQRRPGQASGQNALDYGAAQEARQVLQQQEAALKQAAKLQQQVDALRKAAQQAGLTDPDLQNRLRELSQLYRDLLTPEMRARLQELQKALAALDPQRVQQALQQLAQNQEQFRQRLEQNLELLRRAAVEQKMSALAEDAKELGTQQQALASAMKAERNPSPRARQQQKLQERAKQLQQAMDSLRERLAQQEERQAAQQTGAASQSVAQAQQAMRQAAHSASSRQPDQASQSASSAADSLQAAARSLEQAQQGMTQQWRAEAQRAVDQATNDALALAQRQNELLQRMRAGGEPRRRVAAPADSAAGKGSGAATKQASAQKGANAGQPRPGGSRPGGDTGVASALDSGPDALRGDQAAVQEGLEALGRNLSQEAQRSALISQDAGAALARAMLSLQQTVNALASKHRPHRMPIPEASQSLDALNRLALTLLNNQQQIQKSQSGTGVQQALEQLAQMARQQGSVNAQTGALLPMDLSSAALGQNLRRLAGSQREISQQLAQLNKQAGGRGNLLGSLDELKRESDQLAQELDRGRLTPDMLQRQQELFHHLLDSGRTLERDEFSNERVAQQPGDVGSYQAAPLDTAQIRNGVRYPVPTAEQLKALPPEYRRLILEYFERLNRGAGAGPGGIRP